MPGETTTTVEVTLPVDIVEAMDRARGDEQTRDEWLTELLESRFPRKIDEEQEPKVEYLYFGEGENRIKKRAYNKRNAGLYMGKSPRGFQIILDILEREGKPVQLYKQDYGRDILILEETLDDLMTARPIEK